MENNNQPPFAVGQKVVCVKGNDIYDENVKYTIADCVQCKCGTWLIACSEKTYEYKLNLDCHKCGRYLPSLPYWYADSHRFAPLNPPRVSAIPELLKAPVEETLDVIKVPETIKQ